MERMMTKQFLKDGESVVLSLDEALELVEGDFWHPDPDKDVQFDRSVRRSGASFKAHPTSTPEPKGVTASGPAKPNKFSTMAKGTASPVNHASIEDAHLHAHLQAMKTGTSHSIIHNGVKVATHSFTNGEHHVEIH